MKIVHLGLLLLCAAGAYLLAAVPLATRAEPAKGEQLASQAREVMLRYCFDCHGKDPAKIRGDLNVFDRKQLLDKERKIVVPGTPDDSDLVKQVEKGTMPPGKRAKVPEAERRILRDWIAAGAGDFTRVAAPPPPPPDPAVANTQLAARVKETFRTHCLDCHGGAQTKGGVKIFDVAMLLKKKKVLPGKPDESTLFQRITIADEFVMPPDGQPRLSPDDVEAVRNWISLGAPAFPADVAQPPEKDKDKPLKDVVGVDHVLKKILEHVRTLAHADRRYARYFSINHILTSGATPEGLDLQRQALVKAINHLSWEPQLVVPRAIDGPTSTVYHVDIRSLGWHRQPFEVWRNGKAAGRSSLNIFDLALLEYPYAILYQDSETYDRLVEEYLGPAIMSRPVPYVRADWFVSVVTQPPLYEDFLQLPFEIKELEDKLGVDSETNLREAIARRAGMAVSAVSRNNRVVERHPARLGAYWKSFDFRSSKGAENIFKDPLGFHASGGEMIFNLPNGMQGYYVTNATGVRVELAPTEIVTDKLAEDKTVRNGLSCIRCHDKGMKDFSDTIRPAVERMPGSPGFDKRLVLRVYPEQTEMDRLLKEDAERFQTAVTKALGQAPTREPLTPVTQRFLEGPLPLTVAAAELGLANTTGLQGMFRMPQMASLGLMALAADGGLVRRDMWEDYYDQVVRNQGLGVPIVPLDGLTRRDFAVGLQAADVELTTSKKNNVVEPGDKVFIVVTNRLARDVYVELIGTSAQGHKVILASATTVIKAGQQYRYPPNGPLVIQGGLGKEQVTLFASDRAFPPGELLRGKWVTDRVVHSFYELKREGERYKPAFDPTYLIKKTIELETK